MKEGAVADDARAWEVGLCHSSYEAGEQRGAPYRAIRGGCNRGGASGAKSGDQGECGPAKHVPDAEPGKRVTGAERIRQTFAVMTRGKSRMRESRLYGSARGASSNGRPYRDRRKFITLLGGAAVWPLAASAQQRRVIGFLSSSSPESFAPFTAAFRHGLERAGYVEGKDVAIEFRWAQGKYDRLAELAVELVRRNVDVIVTHGTPGTYAAMQATTATPIVMAISGDAVATGIITSLARPGANVTGSTFFLPKLNAKRLELFKEAFPRIARVAALSNPDNPVSRPIIPAMKLAAASLKIALEVAKAQGPSEFETAFTAMARSRVEAVVVTEDGEFASSFRSIAALAADNKLPSIGSKEFAEAGGLIGYGANLLELYRRAAYFVDRIFKGAKPADLAIEQPTKFELVVNLKTAKALGLDIPPMLLARADKVIE